LSNDFRIVADGVSRVHARVSRQGDDYYIADLQSTNGTFLNDRKIDSEAKLSHGDKIRLGRSVLIEFDSSGAQYRHTDISELVNISGTLNPAIKSEIEGTEQDSAPDFTSGEYVLEGKEFFQKAYDRLAILYEVNSSVGLSSDLNETLERIANIVLTLGKADRVAILLIDDDTGEIKPAVYRDKNTVSSQPRAQLSRTIVEKTISEGVGVLSADALSDPRFKSAESIEVQNVRSVICVPLKRKEKVVGAIYVDCLFTSDGFDDEDLRLMMAVSNEASIVVENVRLTERLIQTAKFSALGQFATGIAHEIKNQLGAITLAELIREDYADDKQLVSYADILLEARDHLVGIVSEVRDFSKSLPSEFEKKPVGLVEVAQSALSLIRFDKLFDGIDVISEFAAEPVVMCNRGKIKQVLINILQNAAYAAQGCKDPQICCVISEEPDFGLVRVVDNGCGIAPENLKNIWEPLFTTRMDSGTGLGLDICRKIVGAHNGRIECESPPDGAPAGTAFSVRLPLKK
jgi:signal transduction histidine kinase/pSer/pThr/pTyr-binding forkhead associated (FHA) protein